MYDLTNVAKTTPKPSLNFDESGIVLSVSPHDMSIAMEIVTQPVVETAFARKQLIDIDAYLPVLKNRVLDYLMSDLYKMSRAIVASQGQPDKNFDKSIAKTRREIGAKYDATFSDDVPDPEARARTLLTKINNVLFDGAKDKRHAEMDSILMNPPPVKVK